MYSSNTTFTTYKMMPAYLFVNFCPALYVECIASDHFVLKFDPNMMQQVNWWTLQIIAQRLEGKIKGSGEISIQNLKNYKYSTNFEI